MNKLTEHLTQLEMKHFTVDQCHVDEDASPLTTEPCALPTMVDADDVDALLKQRKVLDSPVISVIAIIAAFLAIGNAISLLGLFILGNSPTVISAMSMILTAIVMLIWFYAHFRGEFEGMLGWSTAGLALALPLLLFAATNCHDLLEAEQVSPIFPSLLMALSAGLTEEVVFRGILGANLVRIRNREKDIPAIVITSALVFGLIHAGNAVMGATVSSTVFQVLYAGCAGMLFMAVFLRCGSLWPVVIMHTLMDFTGFLGMDPASAGIITDEVMMDSETAFIIVSSIIVAAFALYLIRPEKRAEIATQWKRKWHQE